MINDTQRVRVIRALLGLTPKEFAKKIHVQPSAVSAWETGKSRPGEKSKKAIAVLCQENRIVFLASGMPLFAYDLRTG